MLKLATVFSGIGAIEHAIERMNINNEIIFACDNGDVDILTKKIAMDIDEIENELDELSGLINDIQFNDEYQDLYKQQLEGMLSEALEAKERIKLLLSEVIGSASTDLNKILMPIIESNSVKASRKKEYSNFLVELNKGSEIQKKLKSFQVALEITNDFNKDNSLSLLNADNNFKSADGIEWEPLRENLENTYIFLEDNNGKKIIRMVQDLSQRKDFSHP